MAISSFSHTDLLERNGHILIEAGLGEWLEKTRVLSPTFLERLQMFFEKKLPLSTRIILASQKMGPLYAALVQYVALHTSAFDSQTSKKLHSEHIVPLKLEKKYVQDFGFTPKKLAWYDNILALYEVTKAKKSTYLLTIRSDLSKTLGDDSEFLLEFAHTYDSYNDTEYKRVIHSFLLHVADICDMEQVGKTTATFLTAKTKQALGLSITKKTKQYIQFSTQKPTQPISQAIERMAEKHIYPLELTKVENTIIPIHMISVQAHTAKQLENMFVAYMSEAPYEFARAVFEHEAEVDLQTLKNVERLVEQEMNDTQTIKHFYQLLQLIDQYAYTLHEDIIHAAHALEKLELEEPNTKIILLETIHKKIEKKLEPSTIEKGDIDAFVKHEQRGFAPEYAQLFAAFLLSATLLVTLTRNIYIELFAIPFYIFAIIFAIKLARRGFKG